MEAVIELDISPSELGDLLQLLERMVEVERENDLLLPGGNGKRHLLKHIDNIIAELGVSQ